MIRNLLDINRLEEGHLKIAPAPVVFGRVVAELQKRFATLIRLKGLTVGCEDAFARPFPADPDLFARVLQNLLTNAIQHTEEGGSIAFTAAAAPGGGGVRVAVADTGCGIAPEYHDRLFKKFSQADAGDAPRTSTGLGLYFCAMVAKAHGGRIWFESQPGREPPSSWTCRSRPSRDPWQRRKGTLPAAEAGRGGAPAGGRMGRHRGPGPLR